MPVPEADTLFQSPDASDSEPVDVRQRILIAATELFGRQGYSATSVREVVARAGVTKPTLYYYFANKEALFAEAVEMQFDGLQALIGSLIDPAIALPADADGFVASRISTFLDVYVRGAVDRPDTVRLMMTATAPTDASQPKVVTVGRFLEELSRLRRLFEIGVERGELRADLDPDVAASLLAGAADFWMMHGLNRVLAGVEDPLPADFPAPIVSTLLKGLAP
jgi:AcrR family transcriptional regulator